MQLGMHASHLKYQRMTLERLQRHAGSEAAAYDMEASADKARAALEMRRADHANWMVWHQRNLLNMVERREIGVEGGPVRAGRGASWASAGCSQGGAIWRKRSAGRSI